MPTQKRAFLLLPLGFIRCVSVHLSRECRTQPWNIGNQNQHGRHPELRYAGSPRGHAAQRLQRAFGSDFPDLELRASRAPREAAESFKNSEDNYTYSRFTNPTVSMFQDRLAALEGGEACMATASGMAAIMSVVMCALQAGDHLVSSQSAVRFDGRHVLADLHASSASRPRSSIRPISTRGKPPCVRRRRCFSSKRRRIR